MVTWLCCYGDWSGFGSATEQEAGREGVVNRSEEGFVLAIQFWFVGLLLFSGEVHGLMI